MSTLVIKKTKPPLYKARDRKIVRLLIQKGADVNAIKYVNARDKKGKTPLHKAEDIKIVQRLNSTRCRCQRS